MGLRRASLAALLALTVMLGAGPVQALTAWRNATTNGDYETVLRGLVAKEHLRVCGRSLALDSRLTWTARYRATDMVLNRYYAHRNPWTGRRIWTLLRNAGISWSYGAEIIGWNAYPDYLSPSAVYAGFMGSTSHRAAIRSCTYTIFGTGAYKAGTKRMYVVLFLKP